MIEVCLQKNKTCSLQKNSFFYNNSMKVLYLLTFEILTRNILRTITKTSKNCNLL